jgi:hypothetical protein
VRGESYRTKHSMSDELAPPRVQIEDPGAKELGALFSHTTMDIS